ncbi:MAG: carbohydrate kinase [Pseudomonadota bacterium]
MILCCGEALIDMLPAETAAGAAAFVPYVGGAVFNTAIALGRLGEPVGLLTGLSTDDFGGLLRAALEDSGVDTRLAVTTERVTALAFVALSDGQARYSFHDEGSAGRMLQSADIPPLPAEVGALFFGGISLIAEPSATTLEALQAAEGEGRLTMLDPNVRPAFVSDPASYRARIGRMMARADIFKVSDEDLAWLLPDDRGPMEKLRAIAAEGPALALMTRGAEGAVGVTRSGLEVARPARPVDVVDTVGAGDTFNAGFLAGLAARGLLDPAGIAGIGAADLASALDHGMAAAAVVVARAGAQPPWRHELT